MKTDPLWNATKKRWFEVNKPIGNYYSCHYCGKPLTNDKYSDYAEPVYLDHKMNRSHFDLKYNIDNLVACCFKCNSLKGSQSYENFCRKHASHLLKSESE
jgi:5-methylcytosine-specific restriction endonuclease McrA